MKEAEGYRDVLEDIVRTTGKHFLQQRDVCAYLGVSPKTAIRRFGVRKEGIASALLARKLTTRRAV